MGRVALSAAEVSERDIPPSAARREVPASGAAGRPQGAELRAPVGQRGHTQRVRIPRPRCLASPRTWCVGSNAAVLPSNFLLCFWK